MYGILAIKDNALAGAFLYDNNDTIIRAILLPKYRNKKFTAYYGRMRSSVNSDVDFEINANRLLDDMKSRGSLVDVHPDEVKALGIADAIERIVKQRAHRNN